MARRVSDAEYARRYEREVRWYAERFAAEHGHPGAGAAYLSRGKWVWMDDGLAAKARWARYADRHGPLRAMNSDGTWREWEPRDAR